MLSQPHYTGRWHQWRLRHQFSLTLSSIALGRGVKYGLASASLALRRCLESSFSRPCRRSHNSESRGTPLFPSADKTFASYPHIEIEEGTIQAGVSATQCCRVEPTIEEGEGQDQYRTKRQHFGSSFTSQQRRGVMLYLRSPA